MGKVATSLTHEILLQWGNLYRGKLAVLRSVRSSHLAEAYKPDLKNYFALSALSRAKSAKEHHRSDAHKMVFRVRVSLEKAMVLSIKEHKASTNGKIGDVLDGSFFGFSKKQGTSLRMPLSTCTPSALCAGACYAHDVLDATPLAVARGAANGWLAGAFESGGSSLRRNIVSGLAPQVRRAIAASQAELKHLPKGFNRRPFIRFSHVGEIVYYPEFANSLARLVREESCGSVDCVVYTRHRNVQQLDPKLWIINFTLDPASMDRRSWIPPHARTVFSAFGGVTSDIAEVNFLEHHRHIHMAQSSGNGRICPATKPETKVRTCDACRCNRCFVSPMSASIASHAQ